MRTILMTLFLAFAFSAAVRPQSPKDAVARKAATSRLKTHASVQVQSGGALKVKDRTLSPENKLKLLSVGAVIPKDLTEAPCLSSQCSGKKRVKGTAKHSRVRTSRPSGVSEFQAVSGDFESPSGAPVLRSNSSKTSALRNIHGEADGALASGIVGNQVGAAAGATSKSGKVSIFVQTNHATIQEPH